MFYNHILMSALMSERVLLWLVLLVHSLVFQGNSNIFWYFCNFFDRRRCIFRNTFQVYIKVSYRSTLVLGPFNEKVTNRYEDSIHGFLTAFMELIHYVLVYFSISSITMSCRIGFSDRCTCSRYMNSAMESAMMFSILTSVLTWVLFK